MATYSTIKGFPIQSLASDPALTALGAGTWSSGGNLNNARSTLGGAGLQTAALAFGGAEPSASDKTESYNGTAWTSGNAMQTARKYLAGMGTQTAALGAGGWDPPPSGVNLSEEYDGTSWAEGNNLPATLGENRGCGTQTAGLSAGGYNGSAINGVYEYNGTCWSNGGTLGTARYSVGLLGIQTAAVAAGGTASPHQQSETYNGSAWSEGADINTARKNGGGCGGTSTEGIIATGQNPPGAINATEAYDGTSWTTLSATVATDRFNVGSAIGASQATATFFGGKTPSAVTNATEEFSAPATFNKLTEGQVWYNTASNVMKGYKKTTGTGAWASGGNLNAVHDGSSFGLGTQTAAICAGGYQPGPADVAISETYDGTCWAEGNNILVSRSAGTAAGTTTAGLIYGGRKTQSSWTTGLDNVEAYNGTSWTTATTLLAVKASAGFGTCGTQTTAIMAGGVQPPPSDNSTVETYDGTSWTEVNDLNTARGNCGCAGSSAAAVMMGGDPSPDKSITELYDGTSWSEVNNMNTAREGFFGAGTSTLAIAMGGYVAPGATTHAEDWDGTCWTTVASLGSPSQYNAGAGTGLSALVFGGNGSPTTATQEWTVPRPLAVKTFTSS